MSFLKLGAKKNLGGFASDPDETNTFTRRARGRLWDDAYDAGLGPRSPGSHASEGGSLGWIKRRYQARRRFFL